MTHTKDEALKLALEALENTSPTGFNMERDKQFYAAITAIKQALAAPVPVEWMEMVAVNLLREGVNKHKARELAEHFYSFAPAAQPAPVQPVSGVVLRDGYPTLIQDKHIKETDQRLCILPTTPPAAPEKGQP